MLAAVTFLGETFSAVNGVGLCVLILGVVLFNYSKYKKVGSGQVARCLGLSKGCWLTGVLVLPLQGV